MPIYFPQEVQYSAKFFDDEYEYRNVTLSYDVFENYKELSK